MLDLQITIDILLNTVTRLGHIIHELDALHDKLGRERKRLQTERDKQMRLETALAAAYQNGGKK